MKVANQCHFITTRQGEKQPENTASIIIIMIACSGWARTTRPGSLGRAGRIGNSPDLRTYVTMRSTSPPWNTTLISGCNETEWDGMTIVVFYKSEIRVNK